MRLAKARYQHGSIAKIPRASGFAWRVRFSESSGGKRSQKSMTFSGIDYPTESDVRRAIEHAVIQQNLVVERAKVDAQFGDLTALYRTEHMPGLGHATQQTNRYLLASHIEPEFRRAPVREATPLRVSQWVDGLALAPTTKASIRSVMSQCFELAALHGYLPAFERNPMSLVKIKGRSKRQKKITRLHIGQVRKLLEQLPEPINIMTLVTASLGLRISETLALRWSDIDWKEKEISIVRKFTHGALGETKTDASAARLPLDAGVARVLGVWKKKSKGTDWVFPSSRTGGPRSASTLLQKGLAPAVKELGLGGVTWHTLRHAYRAWIDAAKTPVGVQKDLMRHADPAMTLKYGSSLSEDMRKAHDSVARKLIPANLLKGRSARTKQRR